MTINLILLGRLTSTFTLESANNSLSFQQKNVSIHKEIKIECSWDIELNLSKYAGQQR